jgi:hypothetical protein
MRSTWRILIAAVQCMPGMSSRQLAAVPESQECAPLLRGRRTQLLQIGEFTLANHSLSELLVGDESQ